MIFAVPALPPPHPMPAPTRRVRVEREMPYGERRRDPLAGLALHLELDEGRIVTHINASTEEAYLDAAWPHNGTAMSLMLNRIHFWGYMPIPEDETPAEVQPDGKVRIYLMEL